MHCPCKHNGSHHRAQEETDCRVRLETILAVGLNCSPASLDPQNYAFCQVPLRSDCGDEGDVAEMLYWSGGPRQYSLPATTWVTEESVTRHVGKAIHGWIKLAMCIVTLALIFKAEML